MQNIQDAFYQVVEEYNSTVKRKDNLKDFDMKGAFYNTLRRYFPVFNKLRTGVRVSSIDCEFNKDGTILNFKINRSISVVCNWTTSGENIEAIICQLKKVGESHKVLYPTKNLNELSQILKL